MKGAFEYDSGKIIALVDGQKSIRFINRNTGAENDNLIANLSQNTEYRSLRPFPRYNYKTFPYVIIKDSKSLNVINVRTMQSRVILKDSPFSWDADCTYAMELQRDPRDEKCIIVYNLELENIPSSENSSVKDRVSTIKKFSINLDLLDSCFL